MSSRWGPNRKTNTLPGLLRSDTEIAEVEGGGFHSQQTHLRNSIPTRVLD